MSHDAIAACTATLVYALGDAVKLADEEAKVTHVRPDEVEDGAIANVYLYGVQPNASLRNHAIPERTAAGHPLTRPMLALDLDYLVTFHGQDDELIPQRLLGTVAAALTAEPVFGSETVRRALSAMSTEEGYEFLVHARLYDQVPRIRVTPMPMDLETLSRLWGMWQTSSTVALNLQASVVLVRANLPEPTAPLPVLRRGVQVLPSLGPVVTGVSPATGVVAGGELVLEGRDLRGPNLRVRFDGDDTTDTATTSATPTRLVLTPPALDAGAHTAQVRHEVGGVALTSSAVAFVLRPTVTAAAPNGGGVQLTVSPVIRAQQDVVVQFVPSVPGPDPVSIPVTVAADTATVQVAATLTSGTWWVRLRVDRVMSPMTSDSSGFTGPSVVIP
jgi:hypothetical protein